MIDCLEDSGGGKDEEAEADEENGGEGEHPGLEPEGGGFGFSFAGGFFRGGGSRLTRGNARGGDEVVFVGEVIGLIGGVLFEIIVLHRRGLGSTEDFGAFGAANFFAELGGILESDARAAIGAEDLEVGEWGRHEAKRAGCLGGIFWVYFCLKSLRPGASGG